MPGRLTAAEPAAATAEAENESEARVRQLLWDAQQKREAGQTTEALADLRAANAVVKKAKGASHPDALPVLDLAGAILFENGQFTEAQAPLQKAVSLRETLVSEGQQVPALGFATALAMLAKAQMAAGTFDKAADLLTKAVGLFDSGSDDPGHDKAAAALAAVALEQLADVHFALGDSSAALAVLQQLHDRHVASGVAAAPQALVSATLLARGQSWAGQAAEAIEPLTAAIAAFERARGDAKALPPALRQLAELQTETGDYEAARERLERVVDIDRKTFGDGRAAVIIDQLKLLRIDSLLGVGEAALTAAEPLVKAVQSPGLQDDPLAAAGLLAAAEVWLQAGDLARAAELSQRAFDLDTRRLGSEHPDTATAEAVLGRGLLESGDVAAARPRLEHALTVVRRVRGPAHPETLDLVAAVGNASTRANDLKAAEASLKTILDHGAPPRNDAAENTVCGLADAVAALQAKAGDLGRAKETRDSLIQLRQKQCGEEHEHVAAVIVRLANARQQAGAHAEAASLYERAVAMMETLRGADHPDVALILTPLAVSYRELKANDKAEQVLARGLAIWEASLGPDHPMTTEVVKRLALVRLVLRKDEAALPLMTRLLAAYDADPATPPVDRIKLLKKLAQIHEGLGDSALSRRYLSRAVEIEAALAKKAAAEAAAKAAAEAAAKAAAEASE
jgi:tetratricopeptide (TPR) repeat protein